jgi:8-oxo-dGTP pyrophosphatase MutT (NUDIX family)
MTLGEEFSDRPAQDELHVPRWTSEKVLTVGVEQGWADPEDWRAIDFSARPSCEGPYEFDHEGRPLNRHRTPDMPGDRGDLGQWGPNYAAESLIVAVDGTGKRYILLARRNDPGRTEEEQQWSLPGGMVNAGEHASTAAIREVREETGTDLAAVPFKTLYQMYADDYRNTRNSWIETTGTLQMLHYTPETRADGVEISATRWFELPDTLEQLEEQTGKLFASHGNGVQIMLGELRRFKHLMDDAQQLHGQGKFAEARERYLEAANVLPDPLERGRAIRGAASGAERMGDRATAISEAKRALEIHDRAVRSFPKEAEMQATRERAASRGVLGKIAVSAVVRQERLGELAPAEARAAAQKGLACLDGALEDILTVEAVRGVEPDQYKINIMGRLALAHTLYGDRSKGKDYARQARLLGDHSEDKANLTSVDFSLGYRLRARARSMPRGYAAVAASRLVTQNASLRRSVTLTLAEDRRLGL